ncbi:MAG: glycosyltransferase [Puia sp.]|nr:glycosyltransferase [Puia sp.]
MNKPDPAPLVSVILTTYNGERFLAAQLDSLFQQTYRPIEILAIDDGSRDRTVSILHEYASRHPNMKVYVNETNLGFIKNFEKGCSLSSGELLSLCDQDDYWLPDKVEKMVAAIGDHAMIFCDSKLCDQDLREQGRNISDIVNFSSFDNCLQLCIFCRMYGHALLITRSLFERARPFLDIIPHDWWLSYTATLHGGIRYLPEALVLYRQHAANVYGIVGGKSKNSAGKGPENKRQQTARELDTARKRIRIFHDACRPQEHAKEKKVLAGLERSYRDFSPLNDFRRMGLFFRNYRLFLTVKKYSLVRKYLFCLKMFVKIK